MDAISFLLVISPSDLSDDLWFGPIGENYQTEYKVAKTISNFISYNGKIIYNIYI